MNDDNNQELIRAIDRLTGAVTGGVLVIAGTIAGTIFLYMALVTSRSNNGLVGIVSNFLLAIAPIPTIWVGLNIMTRR
jgi:hypothetical protein